MHCNFGGPFLWLTILVNLIMWFLGVFLSIHIYGGDSKVG